MTRREYRSGGRWGQRQGPRRPPWGPGRPRERTRRFNVRSRRDRAPAPKVALDPAELAERIRERLAKRYWSTPAKAYFYWGLPPDVEEQVRAILAARGIWRSAA